MDRQTTYSGQVPRTVDLLQTQQNIMAALAKLSATLLGSTTIVDGFTLTPTTPASLDVVLTPGTIYQMEDLEQTTWSALSANLTTQILKQGIGFVDDGEDLGVGQPATMAITPPSTFGYSQVYLIEVQYQDNDTGSLVLPYYNADNPPAPFAGPGNAGTAQNTVRQGGVAYQVKAGVATTTGQQVAPTVDPGWVGLFTVTVAQGQTTITAGNIATLIGAPPALPTPQPPFVPVTVPQVPVSVQAGMWCYGTDTSTTINQMVASFNPAISTLVPGMTLRVKVGAWATVAFTGTVSNDSNQITAVSSTAGLADGQELYGANIPGGATISSISGSTITMSANATGNATGESITAQGNTGAVTLNVGTGYQNVTLPNGASLPALTISGANQIIEVTWDGSKFQLTNVLSIGSGSGGSGTVNNYFTTNLIPYTADTSSTANQIVAPFNPAVTPSAGTIVVVKLANTVTGPTEITVNSLSPTAVVNQYLQPLQDNDAVAGEMLILSYTGSVWQLMGAGALARQFGGLGATFSELTGSAPGGTKTASWSVPEAVIETALGGIPYKGANLSINVNGANVGPNGMDSGSMPISADVSVYLIYDPTSATWAGLICAGSTSNGLCYTGDNMPAGYVASGLMCSGKTDGSGNFVAFNQVNRDISVVPVGCSNSGQTVSVAAVVPANAKSARGSASLQVSNGSGSGWIGSTTTGIGGQTLGCLFPGAVTVNTLLMPFANVLLVTPQTLYVDGTFVNAGNGKDAVYIGTYSI